MPVRVCTYFLGTLPQQGPCAAFLWVSTYWISCTN